MRYEELVERFRKPGVLALALMGSQARGDAGPFSDIDLVRFVEQAATPPGEGSHAVDEALVVVSDVRPADVDGWLTDPLRATECVAGLRTARALWDPQDWFQGVQERARMFVWDRRMQARADLYASREMAGWVEEVHKGLEGLRRGDVGRLLSAHFGLSWGLAKVVRVQRGVLLSGDNAFLDQLLEALGPESRWARLCRCSFGLAEPGDDAPSLEERVRCGLELFVATAGMLDEALTPEDRPVVELAVRRIGESAGGPPGGTR